MNIIQGLAHDIGHHIEKLANDGVEGWEMAPKEVIAQMWTLGSILEELAKTQSIEKLSHISLGFILENVILDEDVEKKIRENLI
jgi:hypothetical protein